jgi:hypothetical protein
MPPSSNLHSSSYSPENFLLFDDSSLLSLYCQAVAAVGLAAPIYLLAFFQEVLGGAAPALTWGLRATGGASAFLLLVHFVAANAVVRMPRSPAERKPMAPMHAQHALSLLFTTHQVGCREAGARWVQRRARRAAQGRVWGSSDRGCAGSAGGANG